MSNRGIISTLSIAEKLEAAQKEINSTKNKTKSLVQPILFVNGRLNRKNYPYVAKNFAILKGIENELNHYRLRAGRLMIGTRSAVEFKLKLIPI